ncbi:hypothetical protein [Hymenobacter volaticus]|uniref:Beta-galactosidase n=1 Tax=Hymenobacter volaticus TaxID=2932254 RepID=A0ABY4GE57_9BACT|nr:hypothetical protein [Hymenobacter volaticus]UOQ69138.1 hypothetical protein MUN86_25825 [Hymenobacter volaticus]
MPPSLLRIPALTRRSVLLLTAALAAVSARAQTPARLTTSFDADWRFALQDAPGAEQVTFNDAGWKTVAVPHDWSIAGPYDRANPPHAGAATCPAAWAGTASSSPCPRPTPSARCGWNSTG